MQPTEQVRKDIGMKPKVEQKIEPKAKPVPKKIDGKALWEDLVKNIAPLMKGSDFKQILGIIDLSLQSKKYNNAQREAIDEYVGGLLKANGIKIPTD